MKDAIVFGSYAYKGWHSLSAGTVRDLRVDISNGATIVEENKFGLHNGFGMSMADMEKADKVLVIGRLVWNDVFGHYQETGFAFYTEDIMRQAMKVPAGILPAFRIIDMSEVPAGMPVSS